MNKFTEETVFDAVSINPEAFGVVGWERKCGWDRDIILLQLEGCGLVPLTVFTKILNNLIEQGASFRKDGEVVVTTNEDGECVLVSRQDEDHKILKVIWEKK